MIIDNPVSTNHADDRRAARRTAMDALARREYAARELHNKLCGKGFSAETADAVVAQLQAENLLSDERYAEAYAHAHINKGQGPLRLRHGLQAQDIDSERVRALLEETDWLALAREVRQKRFGPDLPDNPKEYARQARFLGYRGFSAEQVRAVLRGSEDF